MKVYELEQVRTDGWFEQLAQGSSGFAQLSETVGERFVAFSVIAGLRITALTVDQATPSASLVEFESSSGQAQKASVAELREQLVRALLAPDEDAEALSDEPTPEDLQSYIGFKYVLLAPLFGWSIERLEVEGGAARVTVFEEDIEKTMGLSEFRAGLKGLVRNEAERIRSASPFAIDLASLPSARSALEAGDHSQVAELLGAWPGPLSLLLRTAEGQRLSGQIKGALADALGMLGSAYAALDRPEWAMEVFRLAIQWGQDQMAVSATLFRRMGDAHVAGGRFGEAIGLFRRALSLGESKAEILPGLARCYLERERYIAAMLCLEEAVAAGVPGSRLADDRKRALDVLSPHWERFRERVGV